MFHGQEGLFWFVKLNDKMFKRKKKQNGILETWDRVEPNSQPLQFNFFFFAAAKDHVGQHFLSRH